MAWYWSKGATKPLAAICLDSDGEQATLSVMTKEGGRFTKTVGAQQEAGAEGWTEVGEVVHG